MKFIFMYYLLFFIFGTPYDLYILKKIVPTNLLFEEIDDKFVKKVKNYIDN